MARSTRRVPVLGLAAIALLAAGVERSAATSGASPSAVVRTAAPGSAASALPAAQSSDVTLDTGTGVLAGTLLVPASPARPPVVLIIAGSGPTDRDGNSAGLPGKNDSLRMLAEALATRGIASLRYDKRGIGQSAKAVSAEGESGLRFEHYVDDAARWIVMLRNDARFPIVGVVGHSEGSLIGMLAARMARADAFVSVAGVARRASLVLRDQLAPQLSAVPALGEQSERILKALEAGETAGDVPPALLSLYRPSVQPYLISWFRYDPAAEIAKLMVPVVILQGTTDIQVSVDEAKALAAAKPDATLRIVDGMNHIMKHVSGGRAEQIPTYSDPSLPIVADVPDAIAGVMRNAPPLGRRGTRGVRTERRSPRQIAIGTVGGVHVAIEYGSPQKRGREIWGALVPWGRVWMPGADEATTITTSGPIRIGDLDVPAGDHTLYTLPADGPTDFTLIVSHEVGQFHTVYHEEQDLGRVRMALSPEVPAGGTRGPAEGLTFQLTPDAAGAIQLVLSWDNRHYSVPLAPAGPARVR
ncbi:MAG: alpha/beta fold hydrolase [Vicinamibacterales bacterium]